ncbi:MAG: S46 family peptidase [Ignavibacteriales bacterium]|nr:MAG: S46 family peptidase [Ignavibacteriales bacterium]
MNNRNFTFLLFVFLIGICFQNFAQETNYNNFYLTLNPDTVKPQRFDMGKMWTFDFPPLEYFKEEYDFSPSKEWLDKVQKSALRYGNGCSASFVSGDGLIMTNHHCTRGDLPDVQKEGEDLLRDGFYAATSEEERQMPGLFVDQLILIEDVTDDIKSSMNAGANDDEKVELKRKRILEIETAGKEKNPDLYYKVVTLYNGGKYSLYGYKRYNDIRLVFVPDLRTAKLGGDYDNFTYPRYGLDCAFFRAYENGKPVKTENYFEWSDNGAVEDEPIFVVGNPGTTTRIHTIAQIQFARDIQTPMTVALFKDLYAIYEEMVMADNAENFEMVARLYSIGNGLKVYEGTYKGLLDPYLMARKVNFEKEFKEAVQSNIELNKKYGHIWNEISQSRNEASLHARELFSYSLSSFYSPVYFRIARDVIQFADQLKLDEDKRKPEFRGDALKETISKIFPEYIDESLQEKLFELQLNLFERNLGSENKFVKDFVGSNTGGNIIESIMNRSLLTSKEKVDELCKLTPDEILNSNDPFIKFRVSTRERLAEISKKEIEIQNREAINNQLLGEALYKVYGDVIPPDATFTLRIADGVMKSYDYNGTKAPLKTTFYGVLDHYYSYDKKFPFNLSPMWENLPEEFDLSTPLNFISTNDIIGGNSGSPVINRDAEIVGLAFDGNIESLSARYIYTTEANRTVSVHSSGMIEAIRDLYRATRLSDELLSGKMK